MAQLETTAAQEWRANWPIVFAATAGITFSPIPTASMGFFIDPLHTEFAWKVAAITSGLTIQSMASTFLVPFAGALADRYGARAVAAPSIVMAALSFAAMGLVTGAMWQWTAIWVVYSLVSLGTRSAVWSTAISKAFVVRRGEAERGAVWIKVATLDRKATLFGPAPAGLDDAGTERQFILAQGPAEEADIDARLARERGFDSDIWVIEIEDRAGRHLLDDELVSERGR